MPAGPRRGRLRHVETRPIYLQFTRERFDDPDGAKYAGAPPLRDAADRDAMWEGAADGAIDTVCTDHAPWTLADKLDPALDATELRQGMAELETTLPVLWSTGVRTGRLSVERLVSLLSTAPARLFGMYPTKGAIAVGSDADLVVPTPTTPARSTARRCSRARDGRRTTGGR